MFFANSLYSQYGYRQTRQKRSASVHPATLDAIILIDNDGLINLWNNAAEQLFGWTQAEAIGKRVHEVLAPDDCHHAATKTRETAEGITGGLEEGGQGGHGFRYLGHRVKYWEGDSDAADRRFGEDSDTTGPDRPIARRRRRREGKGFVGCE